MIFSAPLCALFNLILSTATFPEQWKLSRICPILKDGNPSDIKNYRPIAILSNFAKVFEMTVYTILFSKVRNFISPNQHGFVTSRSTLTNLAEFTQFVSSNIDNRGQVDVVYTDFSKAFDKVNHGLLIYKLDHLGFSNSLLRLFRSYLSQRKLYVSYNGFKSNTFIATSGVPQGSNLGPLLFILFINDLSLSLRSNHLFFADDLKLFLNIHSISDCLNLQLSIDLVEEWCSKNQLPINVDKCKICSFTHKTQPILFNYNLNATALKRCNSVKDLGVIMDDKFSFSNHINQMVNTAYKTLGFVIRNSSNFNDVAALKCLYYSLVRSKLEYCSIIWYPFYRTHIDLVESVQRRFLKFLSYRADGYYPPRGYNHSFLLQRFNFDSLHTRRVLASLSLLFKLFHNRIDSASMLNMFDLRVPRLGSRDHCMFYCHNVRTNLGKKSPVYVMSINFNQISSLCDLHTCTLKNLLLIGSQFFHDI